MDRFTHILKSKIFRLGNSQGIRLPHFLIQQRDHPTRVPINFKFKNGQIALEQLRTVDQSRLIKPLGKPGDKTRDLVLNGLGEIFTE